MKKKMNKIFLLSLIIVGCAQADNAESAAADAAHNESAATEMKNDAKAAAHEAGHKAQEAAHTVGEKVGKVVDSAAQKVKDGAHLVAETAKDGAHAVAHKAKNLKDKTVEKIHRMTASSENDLKAAQEEIVKKDEALKDCNKKLEEAKKESK